MRFLMYSTSGEGAQISLQLQREGNDVGLFIKDKIYKTVFDGLVQKVNRPDDFVDSNTIIIFDISGNGDIADYYKKKGNLVFGASSFHDKLEHDRKFGFDTMQKSGIMIPGYKEFTDFNIGLQYVESTDQRLVFKPTGSMPVKLTYVSKDSKELIAYMKFVEKHFGKDIDSFILQEFIEGVVVSSEFFCNGKEFLCGSHTVEVKKSMNDELGPSTGCSGNVTWPCNDSNIMNEGVKLVENLCVENNFIGQIDLNAVVNEEGVYGLEWTPRFGYDATPTLLYLLEGDFGKFFHGIANGDSAGPDFDDLYAASIRVSIPPYPAEPKAHIDSEGFSPNKGVPIQNYEDKQNQIYFYEVCLDDNVLVHSGGTGVICCTLSSSEYSGDAIGNCYHVAEDLVIPDKQYRTDLENVLSTMVEEVLEYV